MLLLLDKPMSHHTALVLGGVCVPDGLPPSTPEVLLAVKRLVDAVGSSTVSGTLESILLEHTNNTNWEISAFKCLKCLLALAILELRDTRGGGFKERVRHFDDLSFCFA